jgi:hypothetical protein
MAFLRYRTSAATALPADGAPREYDYPPLAADQQERPRRPRKSSMLDVVHERDAPAWRLSKPRTRHRGNTRLLRDRALGNVLAALDPSHQPLELLRRLGTQIRVVHPAKLIGDGKQRLGSQANNVLFAIVVGDAHLGSPYLDTRHPAATEGWQRRHRTKVPLRRVWCMD